MALTDESNGGMVMPVSPMYGNGNGGFGFGGDSWGWIILLLLIAGNGGWGFGGGFGGMGGFAADGAMLYPWMNQAEITSDGFRDQMLNNNVTSIRDGINAVQTQLCNGFAGVNATISNGFANAEQGANARQIANMQQMFALQNGVQSGFNATNTGIADLKYTVATENCADRTQAMQNTRDIIDSQTRSTQAVLDKLCQLELDGYKREADQLRAENSTLKNQGFIANEINQQNEVFYNRLKNCPVNAVPVFGNQPIFTCGNNGCGCNGNAFYN